MNNAQSKPNIKSVQTIMLYALRKAHGLSQKDMSQICEISISAYCQREINIEQFTKRDIDKLIAYFEKPYEEIFKEVI